MKYLLWIVIVGCMLVCIHSAHADTTTINYKGQPPPSAISPSMSAFSQDVCAVPVSGAVSTTVFGVSGGTVLLDENCVRLKNAKAMHDFGLKISALALLCQKKENWEAMDMAGTYCPIGGSIGYAARKAWYELHPDWFRKLYGETFVLPEPPADINTTKGK